MFDKKQNKTFLLKKKSFNNPKIGLYLNKDKTSWKTKKEF